jgi:NAD(P)H-flavin reductase
MIKSQEFKAKVADRLLLNEKFQYLHLELLEPYRIEFQAGQYISLEIDGERRSYSIASAPAANHEVELCVDVTPGGKGSTYLKNLRPGDELKFLGPLGQFVTKNEEKLLLVATGSGIAPLRSMILDLLETKQDKRLIRLFWGLRFVADMFWLEDFRQRHKHFPNFCFNLVLSKPPEGWPLTSGHVTKEIAELALDQSWGVYLCGNQAMIEEVSGVVGKRGVPQSQIHFEKFFS